MKLLRFKVTNFRSVQDSGWLELNDVTAFIGVNESGKTNLLLPLWKFKPAREGEVVPVSDYPKSLYGTIREAPEKFFFVTVVFDSTLISRNLATICGYPSEQLTKLEISRNYKGGYVFDFPNAIVTRKYPKDNFLGFLRSTQGELESVNCSAKDEALRSSALKEIKSLQELVTEQAHLNTQDLLDIEATVNNIIPANPAKTNTIVPVLSRLVEETVTARESVSKKRPGEFEGVWKLIWDNIPNFIYYSNYGNLDSEIYLPHVVENLKRNDLGSKEAAKARTLRVLFRFVRLSPEEILELGQEDAVASPNGRRPTQDEIDKISAKKRERSTLLQSAGTQLTGKFKDWWKQGDYRFRFEADGNFFQIWVSDDRRPDEVELEGRSTGLQWFLSFYLVFLVESREEHSKSILLLDEPGISLHPLAQRDLSAFFDSLSKSNQLVYTTHSPFLVDADHLDRVRKVYVDANGKTQATEDLRQGASEPASGASYAVSSALNLSVAESLLLGCLPVIVEGPADQVYLTAIKTILISAKRISPGRELVFPPSGGTKTIRSIASILMGRDERLPKVLLDADVMGAKMRTELSTSLYVDQKEDLISVHEHCDIQAAEVEDLFPAAFIATNVDKLFRNSEEDFSDVIAPGKPMVGQIEAWAANNKISLEKGWKVELAKRVKQQTLTKGTKAFDEATLDRWANLFEKFLS